MMKLKGKYTKLNRQKTHVISELNEEHWQEKRTKEEVAQWLASVQRIDAEIQSIENAVEKGGYFQSERLGKLVANKIEEIKELCQKGRFSDGLVVMDENRTYGKKNVVCGVGGNGKLTIKNCFRDIKSLHIKIVAPEVDH
ncbi:hypothetical protein L1049_012434 [Liquidambar formosana]|uniref:Uncharacterized protein n=1 Tax=Liquidambar formosana TaxID=63359 RepID=A0AAP0N3M2_LIQFO